MYVSVVFCKSPSADSYRTAGVNNELGLGRVAGQEAAHNNNHQHIPTHSNIIIWKHSVVVYEVL